MSYLSLEGKSSLPRPRGLAASPSAPPLPHAQTGRPRGLALRRSRTAPPDRPASRPRPALRLACAPPTRPVSRPRPCVGLERRPIRGAGACRTRCALHSRKVLREKMRWGAPPDAPVSPFSPLGPTRNEGRVLATGTRGLAAPPPANPLERLSGLPLSQKSTAVSLEMQFGSKAMTSVDDLAATLAAADRTEPHRRTACMENDHSTHSTRSPAAPARSAVRDQPGHRSMATRMSDRRYFRSRLLRVARAEVEL